MSSPLLWFGDAAKFLKNVLKFQDSIVQISAGASSYAVIMDDGAGAQSTYTSSLTQTQIYQTDGITDNRIIVGVADTLITGSGELNIQSNNIVLAPLVNLAINTDVILNGSFDCTVPVGFNVVGANIQIQGNDILTLASLDVMNINSDTYNLIAPNISLSGNISVNKTITAGGTTGNQTINKTAGTVNIAAAGTSVTVTNSLVTANSIVLTTVRTNDATALVKNVVCSAGSFTININAAVTSETSIGFFVVN